MSKLELKSNFCKLDAQHRLNGLDIPVIGLTGGIATGKSTVSKLLKDRGVAVIDADALVKDIYAQKETEKLVASLAPEVISDGSIDFKKLRQLFFSRSELKAELERHIYARLPDAFMARLAKFESPGFVVYDVPLLFEKGLESSVDITALVYAPKEIQLERATSRDRIDRSLAKSIIANQMPINTKKELADFTLENTSDIKHLSYEVERFLDLVTVRV